MLSAYVRPVLIVLLLTGFTVSTSFASGQSGGASTPDGPTDSKARKTFAEAVDLQKRGDKAAAMESFRKANKQDGGHCADCLNRAFRLALEIGEYKVAEEVGRDMLAQASSTQDQVNAHYYLATALQREGINNGKPKCFSESCDEFKAALAGDPGLTHAHFAMGVSLAYLHQDDDARREFAAFLDQDQRNPSFHSRAERYRDNIELARARMAPPFSLVTLDGQHVSMDGLAGKVVLIDFWATWCGPCREALPHIKQIAGKFTGQPLVVLSISLDNDENKWKDFVQKNGMTWLQYRDGGFDGRMARMFGVTAIPSTFTIDADGVLEDQHVGDASIEGKLKKLISRAAEAANRKPAAPVPQSADTN